VKSTLNIRSNATIYPHLDPAAADRSPSYESNGNMCGYAGWSTHVTASFLANSSKAVASQRGGRLRSTGPAGSMVAGATMVGSERSTGTSRPPALTVRKVKFSRSVSKSRFSEYCRSARIYNVCLAGTSNLVVNTHGHAHRRNVSKISTRFFKK
jgi:hypothetical protein